MKAVVDDKIPFIRGQIEKICSEVVYLPGGAISAGDVQDADVLVVRTRTHCNRALLEESNVQFIATATIGFDHLDVAYLAEKGIAWSNCPGCNAASVGQYIHSCLLRLKRDKGIVLENSTIGIIGLGHVGTAVREAIRPLGIRILVNDPPRQEREGNLSKEDFAPLEQLQREGDILSFHTPLVKGGPHPTFHLADSTFFAGLKRKPVLINAGRGEVVDNVALLHALEQGAVSHAIIDTWENEPAINLPLLYKVYIGTPHIAGYSADGKANATRMVLEAICRHFGLSGFSFEVEAPALSSDFLPSPDAEELALQLYDPLRDSEALKQRPEDFEKLRGNYPLRREEYKN